MSSKTGWNLVGLLLLGAGLGAYFTRSQWLPLLDRVSVPATAADLKPDPHDHSGGQPAGLVLSDSARENLELQLGKVQLQEWWRTASMPGVVTEQPGHSERRITTSLNGIVVGVHVYPGQTVKPGDPLLDLQPTGELLTTAQSSLLKTLQDLELLEIELKRITPLVESGALPARTKIEKEYDKKRLESQRLVQMQELLVRGLTAEQITRIVETKTLIREFTIRVPTQRRRETPAKVDAAVEPPPASATAPEAPHTIDDPVMHNDANVVYSVESIDIFPGKLISPGEELCDLALHTHLNIVGHAFEREASLVGRAIKERWPLRAIFETGDGETLVRDNLRIRFAENTIDPSTRTLRFHIPLPNEVLRDDEGENGIVYRSWLFKPGQKVKLLLPVEKFSDRIVLPADAVVREGADAFVFRANGRKLERVTVHIEHLDARDAILKKDGSLQPGDIVALNQAYQLNLALKKAQGSGSSGHGHDHDHSGHGHEH